MGQLPNNAGRGARICRRFCKIMPKRFVCKFAVGQNGIAYSGTWGIWARKNKPDLYLGVENIAGDIKASVHCPWPPHTGWRRHLHIPYNASGEVALAVKKDSGPHQLTWPGCSVGPDTTLEFRIIFRGSSLDRGGFAAASDTMFLPVPSESQCVDVAVLLGPATAATYPRRHSISTHLLCEGRLADGKRVWVTYYTAAIDIAGPSQQHVIVPAKHYVDQSVDLTKISSLRGATLGVGGI